MKVLSVEVKEIDPRDPAVRRLNRNFNLSCFLGLVPFIGPWLIKKYKLGYAAVRYHDEQ